MFGCSSTTFSAKNATTTSKSTKNASVLTTSKTAPKSRKPYKLGTPTCLATIQTKGATTRRAEAERATNKRLDKCFKDMKPAPPFNKANFKPPYPNKFQSNSSNSNKQPWKKRANKISTTRNGRAAAKQMMKAHAATRKEKLKTSTRSTTNASKPIT